MRTVILETRDGWRKQIAVPSDQSYVRVGVMSARDFALDREAEFRFDPTRDAHYRYMEFEWDGETTDDEVATVDGGDRYRRIEVWRER